MQGEIAKGFHFLTFFQKKLNILVQIEQRRRKESKQKRNEESKTDTARESVQRAARKVTARKVKGVVSGEILQ